MTNDQPFKVGDKVVWTSQSSGVRKTKYGTVVQVLAPKESPPPEWVKNPGWPRKHISYLVRADGKRYWPRASMLRRDEEQS